MKKVIVCGGRTYSDGLAVAHKLNHLDPEIVVTGGCPSGADKLAGSWARRHGRVLRVYFADWDGVGKSAGPRRNEKMLDEERDADCLVVFPGGRGTEHCRSVAEERGMPVTFGEVLP